MFKSYDDFEEKERKNEFVRSIMKDFPDDIEILKWWEGQAFQKEQDTQEYNMLFEIDLPQILKAFTKYLLSK